MANKREATLNDLYNYYRDVIKPLLATVEATLERFPEPIFNEVRAFNDHIARSFKPDATDEYIDEQLKKSQSHLTRITLDCYKCLNIAYNKKIERFEGQTKSIDLTSISNGEFYLKYKNLRQEAINTVKKAKQEEIKLDENSFNLYQDGYNKYFELDEYISNNFSNVNWARAKFYGKRVLTGLYGIVSFVVGCILTNNNQEIVNAFVNTVSSIFE